MTVVSRWLVIPMAAILYGLIWVLIITSDITNWTLSQISVASCSTQPGCGKYWGNSFWLIPTLLPS